MKKVIISLFIIFSLPLGGVGWASAQNLVLNPSFEYINVPCAQAGAYYTIPPWATPSYGTPDYFNTCYTTNFGVPQNGRGYQYPRTGDAYMGMGCYLYQGSGPEIKEYLQAKLIDTLKRNKIYSVKFYVTLANNGSTLASAHTFAITKLGAYFSVDSIFQPTFYSLSFNPQVESPPGFYLTDTLNWMEISGTFIPQGGEHFIVIGNFNAITDTLRLYNSIYNNVTTFVSFYFIDDISVKESGSVLNQTACDSYILNGQTYINSGTYTQIVPNYAGSDSTLLLHLTINHNTSGELLQTACNSFTYGATTYTTTGIYNLVYPNSIGCDSTYTLKLTINNDTVNTLNLTGCDSVQYNSQTYTSSNSYTQHYTSAHLCDSTFTLNVTITQPVTHTLIATACNSYNLNSQTYTSSGTYTQYLTTTAGCDSTLTLNLTIDSTNTTVNSASNVLTAESTGTYQWLNCTIGYSPITGATSQTYTATATGDYAVIITNGSCLDTSACVYVMVTGINELGMMNEELEIYPNPATKELRIRNEKLGIKSVKIYNVLGECVMSTPLRGGREGLIDMSGFAKGIYFVRIEDEQMNVMNRKIIKN